MQYLKYSSRLLKLRVDSQPLNKKVKKVKKIKNKKIKKVKKIKVVKIYCEWRGCNCNERNTLLIAPDPNPIKSELKTTF